MKTMKAAARRQSRAIPFQGVTARNAARLQMFEVEADMRAFVASWPHRNAASGLAEALAGSWEVRASVPCYRGQVIAQMHGAECVTVWTTGKQAEACRETSTTRRPGTPAASFSVEIAATIAEWRRVEANRTPADLRADARTNRAMRKPSPARSRC